MKHIFAIFFLLFSIINESFACTQIQIRAQDQSLIIGRTLEFGPDLQSRIMNSPRGREFKTTREDGTPTLNWQSRYGYLFVDFFKTGQTLDGMNEKGLSFGYLYLPGFTTYPLVGAENNSRAIPYTFLGDWILGNFATVLEVEQALKNIQVFALPVDMSGQATILPVHAIVTEKSGRSIVIEFINGKMEVFQNPLGILTNSPTFDWQMTNMQNYANLSPYAPNPVTMNNIVYNGTGQGSGLVGLPGDPSPPSRFIKMAMMQQTVLPVADAKSAVILSEHILNNVDIPLGFIRGMRNQESLETGLDKTQWTVFKDLTGKIFYFKSYTNPNLQMIDLKLLDWSAKSNRMAMPIMQTANIINAIDNFKNANFTENK